MSDVSPDLLLWIAMRAAATAQDPGRSFAEFFARASRAYNTPHHCDLRAGEPSDALPIRVFVASPCPIGAISL